VFGAAVTLILSSILFGGGGLSQLRLGARSNFHPRFPTLTFVFGLAA
jgi:hypothetical protein